MNTGLLILLNAQLLAVLCLAAFDHTRQEASRQAKRKYEDADLELQELLKNAAVATYARARGAKRPDELQDAGRQRDGRVLAAGKAEDSNGQHEQSEFEHPSIVLAGQDGA